MPIEAITFDFWDTICRAPHAPDSRTRRIARIGAVLDRVMGRRPHDHDLEQALLDVLAAFNRHWAENVQFTHVEAVRTLDELLGLGLDEAGQDAVTEALIGLGEGNVPDLTPNVADALRMLKAEGIRVGIICDVGLAPSTILRSHLEHHGVLGLFDHWSFSDEVGWFKPAPEIFEHALAGLGGVTPERAAHIGDLRRTDVAGALAMGITAIRYAGITDDPEAGPEPIEADHVIADHAELVPLLRSLS